MIRRLLMCLPLLAVAAAAQENPALEAGMAASLTATFAAKSAARPEVVKVDKCWDRTPSAGNEAVYDSAKLPAEFCLRTVEIVLNGDGGTMSPVGEYRLTGGRPVALSPKAQGLSSYKSGDGTRVYAAYLYEDRNEHGDTGAVFVEFRTDKDGKIVPGSLWADFSVGCPQEECAEGEEPGVRDTVRDWK